MVSLIEEVSFLDKDGNACIALFTYNGVYNEANELTSKGTCRVIRIYKLVYDVKDIQYNKLVEELIPESPWFGLLMTVYGQAE